MGIVGIVTDLDQQGPLTWFLRTSTYSVLAVAVLAAATLGLAAVIRALGRPGVGSLAAFLAGSALGLCLLYTVVLLLPGANAEEPTVWLTLIEVTGTAALGFSAGALLNFAARFPMALPVEEMAARHAANQKRARVGTKWPFVQLVPSPAAAAELERRTALRTLRLVGAGWLPPAMGLLFGGARLLGPFLAGMLLWATFLTVLGGTYLLVLAHHRFGDAPTRARLAWILGGVTLAVWAWVLLGILPFGLGPLLGGVGYGLYLAAVVAVSPPLVYAIIVASLAMATFYQGAIDPGLAVRRSTLFGVTAVIYVAAFGGIENLVSGWVEGRLGLPGAAGAALTGALLALALPPFQGQARRLARRFEPAFLDPKEE